MILLLCAVFVVGWSTGGLLSVVVDRVPRGAPLRGPGAACWCASCRSRVRSGWLAPAAAVLAVAVVAGLRAADRAWLVPAVLALAAVGLALSAIDLRWRRLPDALVLPAYPVVLALVAGGAVVDGSWRDVVRAVIGGGVLFGLFLVLALVSRGGLGLGDVKLAGVLGIVAGAVSGQAVVLSVVLPFVAVAVVSLGIVLHRRGRGNASVPFGPFMVAGTLVSVLAGPQVVATYLTLMS